MEEVDVAVIGAGMAGLAAAYHLRDLGPRLAVLDARRIGNDHGSSVGASRMFREMYSDPYLCRMSQAANRRWRALEQAHGVELRETHGLLFYGEPFDEETIEGSIPGARRVMDAQSIPYEALESGDIAARFPLRPRGGDVGLFEPTAGAIRSDRALTLFARELRAAGAQIHEERPVRTLQLGPDGAVLATPSGPLRARQVVLAAGPWTNALLRPLGLALELELWAMLWAHYAVPEADAHRYPQWFYFQEARPAQRDGGRYYGFPALDRHADGQPRIKVGIDWAPEENRAASWEALDRQPAPHAVALLDAFLREQLPAVGPRLEVRTSPYTMTRDVGFVLDRLHPSLVCFTGGSGQAFKFCPLLGTLLAELVRGDTLSADIGPWNAARLRCGRDSAAAQ